MDILTFDIQVYGVAISATFRVGRGACIDATRGLTDALEYERLVTDNDARCHIVHKPSALTDVSYHSLSLQEIKLLLLYNIRIIVYLYIRDKNCENDNGKYFI